MAGGVDPTAIAGHPHTIRHQPARGANDRLAGANVSRQLVVAAQPFQDDADHERLAAQALGRAVTLADGVGPVALWGLPGQRLLDDRRAAVEIPRF